MAYISKAIREISNKQESSLKVVIGNGNVMVVLLKKVAVATI